MHNVKRYFNKGNIYFLTHVTFNRDKILTVNFDILWKCMAKLMDEYVFDLIAWVVLPDHMHMLIDPHDNNLPGIIRKLKLSFAGNLRQRQSKSAGRVWHNRYWDHIIRNEKDMKYHIDYIHYNPVKHGLVTNPGDYPYSTFSKFHKSGYYSDNWGVREDLFFSGEFGE